MKVDENRWKWMKLDESGWKRIKVDESGWKTRHFGYIMFVYYDQMLRINLAQSSLIRRSRSFWFFPYIFTCAVTGVTDKYEVLPRPVKADWCLQVLLLVDTARFGAYYLSVHIAGWYCEIWCILPFHLLGIQLQPPLRSNNCDHFTNAFLMSFLIINYKICIGLSSLGMDGWLHDLTDQSRQIGVYNSCCWLMRDA